MSQDTNPSLSLPRNHVQLKNQLQSKNASVDFLQKAQEDISQIIKDFLQYGVMGLDEVIEIIEEIKISWKSKARTKVDVIETLDRGNHLGNISTLKIPNIHEVAQKLVSIDQSLLGLANVDNQLGIWPQDLSIFRLKQKLREISKNNLNKSSGSQSSWEGKTKEERMNERTTSKSLQNLNILPEVASEEVVKPLSALYTHKLAQSLEDSARQHNTKTKNTQWKKIRIKNDIVYLDKNSLKKAIIQKFSNKDWIHLTQEEVLGFLHKQTIRWRKEFFKVSINGAWKPLVFFAKQYKVYREDFHELYADSARFELLGKIFECKVEPFEKITKKTSTSSHTGKKKTLKPDAFVLKAVKENILETFGKLEDGSISVQKSEEFLLSHGHAWRVANFRIVYNGENIGTVRIAKLFWIQKKSSSEYFKDSAWYELLWKIFDKEFHTEILTPDIARKKIIETYGDGDIQKTQDFLMSKESSRSKSQFKIEYWHQEIKLMALYTLFDVHREKSNDYYTQGAREEFLSKFFGLNKEYIIKRKQTFIKKAIIEKYGTSKEWKPTGQKALNFLLLKNLTWIKEIFKITPEWQDETMSVIVMAKTYWIFREKNGEYYKEDVWYELLAKIFDTPIEMDIITPELIKQRVMEDFGKGTEQKTLEFLAVQGIIRRTKEFKIMLNKKIKALTFLAGKCGIHKSDNNDYFIEETRFQLLAKIFDKDIAEIKQLKSKKRKV